MAYSEDHIALAAEYAIGTLDADERAQVEAMMSTDPDFMAMVQAWEQRLGALNQMVGLVGPPPTRGEKHQARSGTSRPTGAAAPAATAAGRGGRCRYRAAPDAGGR